MLVLGVVRLPVYVAALTASFTALTQLLVDSGALTPAGSDSDVTFTATLGYYAWNLLDAAPNLEIPQTLHWEPAVSFDDFTSGALLLAYKVAVIVPAAALLLELVRLVLNPPQEPEVTQARDAFRLGIARQRRGDSQQAEEAYDDAAEKGSADAANSLGVLAHRRGDITTAEAAYRRAEELNDPLGAYNLSSLP